MARISAGNAVASNTAAPILVHRDYHHGLAKLAPKRSAVVHAHRLGWLGAKPLSIYFVLPEENLHIFEVEGHRIGSEKFMPDHAREKEAK
jgi:hypothetical protein